MKNKSKNNKNTSLKNPAIIMGVIAVIMILLIIIFNIKNKLNSNTSQNEVQTNSVESATINIDKNSEYAKLIDKYFLALNEKDADKLISLFPSNESYTKENVESQLKQMTANYEAECGSNVEITYEFSQGIEALGQTLEDSKTQIASVYGIESGVTKVYAFEISLTRTGDISTATDTIYLTVAKINGNWYLV